MADEINPQLAGAAVFANAPASGPDDQPITTHEALTNLPDGGAMVWVSPLGPIPSDTAVVDDRGYPPAPQLGTAESYTPDRSSFYAQGVLPMRQPHMEGDRRADSAR